MTVKIKNIDGDTLDTTGVHFKRLAAVKANLRKGYQLEIAPHPSEGGTWLIRVVKPLRGQSLDTRVDAYFEVAANTLKEVQAFIKKDALWDGALVERLAAKVGKLGETHALGKLKGKTVVDDVTGKPLTFDEVKPFQNPSGHGIDMIGRIAKDAEPPPPRKGDFFVFEVKSTLGALENPPGLSRAQKKPKKWVRSRLRRALKATNGYSVLASSDKRYLKAVDDSLKEGYMFYRKINIRMNHAGTLASIGGKKEMEILTWP